MTNWIMVFAIKRYKIDQIPKNHAVIILTPCTGIISAENVVISDKNFF